MWNSRGLNLVIIFLLFHCIGALRHFNAEGLAKGHPEDYYSTEHSTEYLFEKYSSFTRRDISKYDGDVYQLPQLRARRQNTGGTPGAYSFNLPDDTRQYARVNYLGDGSKVIFVLTFDLSSSHVTSSQLYRSSDNGRNFQRVDGQFPSGFLLNDVIYRSPNSRTVIFADDVRSTIYVTTDEGETFSSYNIPVNPRTLKVHPTMPGWMLGHDSNQGVLMYSEDSGSSWATVAQNIHPRYYSQYSIYDFTWGEPGIDWDTNNPRRSDVTKVYYSVVDADVTSSSRNDRIIHVAQNTSTGYTKKVLDDNLGYIYTFILDGSYIFTDKYTCGEEVELYVSYMRNPFNVTRIPTTFSHYLFYVTSHRSSQALIIIQHEDTFNLYLSDETGTYYSLSLEDIVVGDAIDLEIIDSINGTMMANQLVGGRSQTLITFDNGAQWHKIEAQTSDCALPSCSLHFHMRSSTNYWRIGVYSRSSAPGLIVAHGNSGSYLTDTGSAYISRNGGLTWEQTLDYTWHVEIIDHGGVLVAARDNHQDYSRTIRYSCDEGMNWRDFDFINNPIVVWGIVTEPGETTTQVLLFGTSSKTSSSSWIVIHVNFTSIFLRTCETSDYENWTVSDGRVGDQRCLLGETRIIERRKPSVCCWNSRQYERLISATPCECTAADFECEWGYYRDDRSGNCMLNTEYGPNLDCLTGYRKIAGDVCIGGVSSQYLPPDDCALISDNSSRFNNSYNCGISTTGISRTTPVLAATTSISQLTDILFSSTFTYSAPSPSSHAGTGENDNDNNNNSAGTTIAVTVSVVVVVTVVTLIAILFAIRLMSKIRYTASASTTTTDTRAEVIPETPPADKAVVGGSMSYKPLKEEKVDEV